MQRTRWHVPGHVNVSPVVAMRNPGVIAKENAARKFARLSAEDHRT
jgi:hypothetical protein